MCPGPAGREGKLCMTWTKPCSEGTAIPGHSVQLLSSVFAASHWNSALHRLYRLKICRKISKLLIHCLICLHFVGVECFPSAHVGAQQSHWIGTCTVQAVTNLCTCWDKVLSFLPLLYAIFCFSRRLCSPERNSGCRHQDKHDPSEDFRSICITKQHERLGRLILVYLVLILARIFYGSSQPHLFPFN